MQNLFHHTSQESTNSRCDKELGRGHRWKLLIADEKTVDVTDKDKEKG